MNPTIITSLSAEPLDLPLTEPFAIATGTQHLAQNVLVRLTLAGGQPGLGEAAPFPAVSGETQTGSIAAVEAARERLVGQDIRAWRALSASLDELLAGEPAARCGIEMALLDALGRHYQQPLWAFFGGCSTWLETDMTITTGDRSHAVQAAQAIVARGINTIKIKIGAGTVEQDLERLQVIAQALPQARLLADANGGYSQAQAESFLLGVLDRQIPLELLEQPLPREEWQGMAALTRQATLTICADESARSTADVLRLIELGAAHAINIKLMKCGIVEALSMWSIATAAGLRLMIGGMVESLLAMSFSAHFAAGLGQFSYVDLDTPMFIAQHPFVGGFAQTGARLELGHLQAGHGVELA